MRRIVLASESPRRRELMMKMEIPFTIKGACIDETVDPSLSVIEAVKQIALRKAQAVSKQYPNDLIIAADTIVCVDGKILGKPKNDEEAFTMLSLLSGRTHEVITAVCLYENEYPVVFHEVSEVTFYDLSEQEIKDYIATKECFDKAGGYGIQSKGAFLVEKINGDYYNIVGLPIARLYRELNDYRK